MNEYFEERLARLRKLYKDTGHAEYRYKYEELQRAKEWWVVNKIRSEQDTGQAQGWRYDPFCPGGRGSETDGRHS